MWSRALPINRNLTQRSVVCLLNRDFQRNLPLQRFKHATINEKVKENSHKKSHPEKLNQTNQGSFLDKPKEAPLFTNDEPKVFGTLKKQASDSKYIDPGDLADDEHYRNIPLRRDQLLMIRYIHMIQKHIRDKQLKEAIDILEVRMKEDRVKPIYYIYELLIIECGRNGYTKKAFSLYNRMKKRGLEATGPIYAALFNACANTIHPVEGLKLAENLRKIILHNGYAPNEIVYNNMIKAFGRCGDLETAFQLVDEMKERKLPLKVDTMNHLLQVCCSDKEFGFRHALLVWHKIYLRGMQPNVYSFNLMVRCARDCDIGDVDEMKRVIAVILGISQNTARKLKKKENKLLLIEDKPINIINSEEQNDSNKLDKSDGAQNEVASKEVCDQLPNLLSKLPHLGSLVQLSLVKTAEERFALLGGLPAFIAEMEQMKVRPNVKTFSQLLDIIPSTCEAENELIQKMRYMRVRADTDFFNLLMKRRILRKDYKSAMQILEMIDKVNLKPDIVTYGVMAMTCTDRQQAQQFQQNLADKGIRLNIEILGALLRNAIYAKDYDYVVDVLKYALEEEIKPSLKFYEMLSQFKNAQFSKLQKKANADDQANFSKFYHFYKKWKVQIGIDGLSRDEATRLLHVHPWKQLKEGEGEGIEALKNKKTRRYWKLQHTLEKLTPARLDRLQNQNVENDEKDEKNV